MRKASSPISSELPKCRTFSNQTVPTEAMEVTVPGWSRRRWSGMVAESVGLAGSALAVSGTSRYNGAHYRQAR